MFAQPYPFIWLHQANPKLGPRPLPVILTLALILLLQNCTPMLKTAGFSNYPKFKHSDDYWFARQANARLRKHKNGNPHTATVFIIPALLNLVAASQNTWEHVWCGEGQGLRIKVRIRARQHTGNASSRPY